MSNKQEMLYGFCMAALALQLTAVCTDHWSVKSGPKVHVDGDTVNTEANLGLWKACGEIWGKSDKANLDLDACVHLPVDGIKSFPKNSLYAARVFALMGIVLVFISLNCMMYMKNYKNCQLACLVAGGLSSLIAMAVWASELLKFKVSLNKTNSLSLKFSPGYSFYLNLAGGVAALVAAAYYYYGK